MGSAARVIGMALIAITVLPFSGSLSWARNVFEDVWGVVTDPLKLRATSPELSASVERALVQLSSLEGQANAHVEQRLEQIRSIIEDAIGGTQATVDLAAKRMSELEKAIYKDAVELIYRAQCLTKWLLQISCSAVLRSSSRI